MEGCDGISSNAICWWILYRWTVFTPYSCASVANFEQVIPCWDGLYHKKYFLSFNSATTKICVAVRLAADGKRISGI